MANKRVSELSPITAAEIAGGDLLLLADISAVESKKLSADELIDYVQSAITASATSSISQNALTASYLLYQGFPNGTASLSITSSYNLSSSHANWADTASHALFSISASFAKSASYAFSASYAATSSVQLIFSSAFSDQAKSASYLIYTGIPNGTASYAITALLANTAKTASFLTYTGVPNGTASYALVSAQAKTASFLQYNGFPNGTASFALRAGNLASGNTASFLSYNGSANGTASYSISSSYASASAWSETSTTSSYALVAGSVNNVYSTFIKEAVTISGAGLNTASFNFHVTTSNWQTTKIIVEVSGDINLPISTSNWINPDAEDGRSLRIYMNTIDSGPPVVYQSYKPLSITTDATQSLMKFPLTAKTIFTNIDQRAYRIILYLYGSGSFIPNGSFDSYGDGLTCFLHSNATSVNFV